LLDGVVEVAVNVGAAEYNVRHDGEDKRTQDEKTTVGTTD
jgi:hypothetical protein